MRDGLLAVVCRANDCEALQICFGIFNIKWRLTSLSFLSI